MWEIHSSYCPREGIQAADRRMLELTCAALIAEANRSVEHHLHPRP